ncbi:hypothetical protein EYF80_046309 [Liparis tanakae]|uniref:Uncharacterized protein n=1 Tax=Liparis tanakae TaxID=230148 RepID=A0A4Z2FQH5_9TELE|nr:hypothetical protein EYF80_046309 [Liparis tanakae]
MLINMTLERSASSCSLLRFRFLVFLSPSASSSSVSDHGVNPPVRLVLQLPVEKVSSKWEREELEESERRSRVAAGVQD